MCILTENRYYIGHINNFDKSDNIDKQCTDSDKETTSYNHNESNQVWAVICKGKRTALNMLLDIASKRDAKIVKFSNQNNLYIVFDDGVQVTWTKRLNKYLLKNVNRLICSDNIDDEICESILLPLMCCVDGDNTKLMIKKEYCDFDIAILR